VGIGDLVGLDDPEELLEVELGHDNDSALKVDADEEGDNQPKAVVEREHVEPNVIRGDPSLDTKSLEDIGHDVGVGGLDSLGAT